MTQERIKELLEYNPESGKFYRKHSLTNSCKIGEEAGSIMNTGYVEISIDGSRWLGHRAAFLYMKGYLPKYIDHINRVRSDNSWNNLRECTHSDNLKNTVTRKDSRTGFKNVSPHKRSGLWNVSLKIDGKKKSFGYYKTPEEANEIAIKARSIYYIL